MRRVDGEASDRHFITALARGLDVLSCFRSGDRMLGNQEIAARCGLPKSTVSRLTYTLDEARVPPLRRERGKVPARHGDPRPRHRDARAIRRAPAPSADDAGARRVRRRVGGARHARSPQHDLRRGLPRPFGADPRRRRRHEDPDGDDRRRARVPRALLRGGAAGRHGPAARRSTKAPSHASAPAWPRESRSTRTSGVARRSATGSPTSMASPSGFDPGTGCPPWPSTAEDRRSICRGSSFSSPSVLGSSRSPAASKVVEERNRPLVFDDDRQAKAASALASASMGALTPASTAATGPVTSVIRPPPGGFVRRAPDLSRAEACGHRPEEVRAKAESEETPLVEIRMDEASDLRVRLR